MKNFLFCMVLCCKIHFSLSNTVTCATQFSDLNYTINKLICPENCGSQQATLCGSEIYSQGSVCLAAIQEGIIDSSGGPVEVFHSSADKETLTGTFKNGIRSQTCTSLGTNYKFEMTCSTTGDTQFVITEVFCPPGCSGEVYPCGNTTFHLNSSICAAAIKAGEISASGGHVKSYKYTNGSNVIISSFENQNNTCNDKSWFVFSDVNSCSYTNPCQNKGTCVDLLGGFSCICASAYTGIHCETGLGCPSSQLVFPRNKQKSDYIIYNGSVPILKQATVCMWIDFFPASSRTFTLFSYATKTSVNSFALFHRGTKKPAFWIAGKDVYFDATIPRNIIVHLCAWFDSQSNRCGMTINGTQVDNQTCNVGSTNGDGILIVAQDQDNYGGGFESDQSFYGAQHDFAIWPRVLTSSEIGVMFHSCNCPTDYVVAMTSDKVQIFGQATHTSNDSCVAD